MGNSPVLQFFVELVNRIKSRSPRFFLVLQLFGASLTLAGYIPSMLQQWFNVDVPGNVISMCEDIAQYATGFFVAALLPSQSSAVAKTNDGDILKTTDTTKLPFTANAEIKADDKKTEEIPKAIIIPQN